MVPVESRILSEEPTFQPGTPTIRTHVSGPTPELSCRSFTREKLAETDFFPRRMLDDYHPSPLLSPWENNAPLPLRDHPLMTSASRLEVA